MYVNIKNENLQKDVSWSKGKYVALWLCIVGFVYNLYSLSIQYFSYKTEITTNFNLSPNILDLPAITICTPEGFTHTKKDLRSSYPQLNQSLTLIDNSNASDIEKSIWKANNYTIFQMRAFEERNVRKIFANTIQYEEVIPMCMVFTPTYWDKKHQKGWPLSKCVWMADVLQSLVPNKFGKCFTFLSQLNTRLGDKTRFQISWKSTTLIKVLVNMDLFDDNIIENEHNKDKLYMFVHQGNSLPSFDFEDAIMLESGYAYDISFSKNTKKLLPNPYSTNCYEYSKHMGNGYEQCINKCHQKIVKNIFKCIPMNKVLYNDYELKNSKDHLCGFYYTREYRQCSKSCKLDCTQTRYRASSFKKESDVEVSVIKGSEIKRFKNTSIVDIRHRITDDIEYIYKPLLTFNQYIMRIIILSVIWLGLSAFSGLSIIENTFKRAKNMHLPVNDKVMPTLIPVIPNPNLETLNSNAKLAHYNDFIAKVYAIDDKYPKIQTK